ncbi:MAG: diaminopimelate decarboxylase [Bacteroidetes bacterium]|nr:diaminopimelate decarboxylase [Bacteroidota bacterium]
MKLVNGNYQIDGVQVSDLCNKYDTPLYVYETAKMEEQYNTLKKSFKGLDLQINYACKALTNINVLKFFNQLGTGLDTVSIQEVQLGLKAGFKPENILYTPNCVSLAEIDQAIGYGVRINIDNISILEQFGDKYGNTVPLGIRINPHILGGGNSKISTGNIDSKFGISIYQLAHVHQIIESYDLKLEGLHMHTGSDILDTEVFLSGIEIMLNTAMDFKGLKYIDLGSGFKVKYKPDDVFTNIEELGKEVSKRFKTFCREYGDELTLIFEPGKFLVSEAGYFFARVNVIKQTPATVFAGLDTGQNHLIRPMFYDSYHQILNVSRPQNRSRVYSVVGYICETDTFGWNRRINEIAEGDVLCFLNTGAYCFQMSSNYNSRYRPAEVLIHKGSDYLIRERENMEDLLRNQVEVDF